MAKEPTPHRGHASSLSGRPKAFSHVKGLGKGFNHAASGRREKEPLHAKSPDLKQAFHQAHEGPREKLGKGEKHFIYTPHGKVVAEVHSKVDREKLARNREKDLQMKKWRERPIPGQAPAKKPSREKEPQHLLKKRSPAERAAEEKKRSVDQILRAKRSQARGRGGRKR